MAREPDYTVKIVSDNADAEVSVVGNQVIEATPADVGKVVTVAADGSLVLADAAGGVTDHGALTGLADDDHPQYLTSSEAYTPGGTDVAVADGGTGASTAAGARSNLGLGNVDNTSDANKPVSTAQQAALDAKVSSTLVDAKGDILGASADNTPARTAVGTNGQVVIADSAQTAGLKWVDATRILRVVLDGGGSAITTGAKKVYLTVPIDCTITKARLLADVSGSIVLDVWKDTYGNFPPTVADTITASAKPTLSSAQKSEDSTLTGWTTSLSAGDVLEVNVDSATTVTKVFLDLFVKPR